MVITIHQPNFFPYMGIFQKIQESDIFVILKHCQFEKNNYQNRFSKNDKWHTMSVNKGLEPIVNKKYINYISDWNKIKINLYKHKEILSLFDEFITDNLSDTNTNIIIKIMSILDIKTKIVYDYDTNLNGTNRLVDLCIQYNADTYLSGISGRNYLELDKFKKNNIQVLFQNEKDIIKKPIIDYLK
jgi:hypothetical protein